jgi:vitamin B12/bleomycin/antimicrobial peptide transport system ATP-binding/permease protein
MQAQGKPTSAPATRFVAAIRTFARSEVGWRAKLMFAVILALLIAASGLNVANSFVNRNLMSAVEERRIAEFVRQAQFTLAVFAGSTIVAVLARFVEERLGILWREFVTERSVANYMADGTYYRLAKSGELENPDQRIAEDVRAFTATTLSFVLMATNSAFTILAFSGVLWSISPELFVISVVYAALGSYLTIKLARPLVKLNSDQLDREASFRSALIHVRENAEAVMLGRRSERHVARLNGRLARLAGNFRRITSVNRNVGFFSTGYNWLIQLIPVVIIAPSFMRGEVEFGVITQSAMAFTTLVAAFSLIVTQFQSLSTYAAVVSRLGSLVDAIERKPSSPGAGIDVVEAAGRLAFENLTLSGSDDGAPLLKGLSVEIPTSKRTLIAGPNPAAGRALFRATAGAQVSGSGRIIRPPAGDIAFLPQRPYTPPGSLRQILLDGQPKPPTDERIVEVVHSVGLAPLISPGGNLDRDEDFAARLSSHEQQLLALARILLAGPQFVFLDRVGALLGPEQTRRMLDLLAEQSITVLHDGEPDEPRDLYDAILDCREDGSWTWSERAARIMPDRGP